MKRYLFFFFILAYFEAECQDKIDFLIRDNADNDARDLLDRYLVTTDSAEYKISRLLALAKEDEHKSAYGRVMKDLEVALVLEKYVSKPCRVTFELNNFMAQTFSDLNPGYALDFFNKAIAIGYAASDVDAGERFPVLNMLAGLLATLNERDSARACYRLAEKDAEQLSIIAQASTKNNIGVFYAGGGMNDSAMVYFDAALKQLGSIATDSILFCSINDNIAQQEERKKNYAAAIATYRFNEMVYLKRNRVKRYIVNKVRLLTALNKTGAKGIDTDIHSLNSFIDSTYESNTATEKLKFYRFASDYFVGKDNAARAIYFNFRYISLKDSIEKQNTEKLNLLAGALLSAQRIRFKNELEVHRLSAEKNELELKATKQSLYYNRLVAIISVVTGSGIVLLLFLVYRNYKRQREANRMLKEAQAQLIKNEKMVAFGTLASRVAHEIQNPLNFVNNFSELSEELVEEIISSENASERKEAGSVLIENLKRILHHGKRAGDIVKQLQEHTRAGTAHEFFEEEKKDDETNSKI